MRTTLLLVLGLVTSILPAGLLGAQQGSRLVDGPAKGVTVDRFFYEDVGLTAVSYRLSALRSGAVGTEIGVSLFPEALRARALLLAPDFGAAYNVSLPRMTLLVKAGGSAITGLGGDILFMPGIHVGAGLIMQIDELSGIRLDVIQHFYQSDQETESIWSIGLGMTGLRRQRNLPPTR
jgi:hypothetical protein